MVRNEEKTLFRFSKNPHASYDIYRYIVVSFASSPVVPCNWYSAMMDAPTGAVVGPSLDAPRRRLQPGDLLVVPLQGQAWPAMIQVRSCASREVESRFTRACATQDNGKRVEFFSRKAKLRERGVPEVRAARDAPSHATTY